jgi:hypothetical protein
MAGERAARTVSEEVDAKVEVIAGDVVAAVQNDEEIWKASGG